MVLMAIEPPKRFTFFAWVTLCYDLINVKATFVNSSLFTVKSLPFMVYLHRPWPTELVQVVPLEGPSSFDKYFAAHQWTVTA